MHQTLKLYYNNYDDGKGIPSDEPEEMTLEEAISCMEELPESDGNFLGFEVPEMGIVQFMYDDNKGLLLDIPDPESADSYEEAIDFERCIQIITGLYAGKHPVN